LTVAGGRGVEQPMSTRLCQARRTSQTWLRAIIGCNIEERIPICEFRPTTTNTAASAGRLLLPGAFLVAISAQLLAPFVLIDFCFSSFL
jgi:hypothetical protein